MKAKSHTSESKRQKRDGISVYIAASSSRMETGVFAMLGMVGFVAVAIAFVSAFAPVREGDGLPVIEYVRSGRLAADARTWAAMVHYLFEPEPGVMTNVLDPWTTQKNLATPTNMNHAEPRV